MTEDHDEIRDIGDIDEYEANELREMVRKVLENHMDEFVDVDGFVVRVYKDHKRPLTSSAFDIRFQEEIPEEDLSALYDEGADAFLGGRDPDEVDENEAIEYATKYGHVALSMLYPWLFEARRKREP